MVLGCDLSKGNGMIETRDFSDVEDWSYRGLTEKVIHTKNQYKCSIDFLAMHLVWKPGAQGF